MELPLLTDIIVILGLAILVSFICGKFNIPSVVGFLITGAIAGPHGFSLVDGVSQVNTLAEIGIILLLFSIGLEFSIKHLLKIKRIVFWGGTLQVFLTVSIASGTVLVFGLNAQTAILTGFLVALSSTAIALNQLQKQGAIDMPHGKISLGVLIFQDIIVVPLMVFLPFLAGQSNIDFQGIWILLLKSLGLVVIIIVGSRWVIPFIFLRMTKTQNRELFLIALVFVAFGIAWLTSNLGLSLALGAFIAGLMIADSPYSQDAVSHILPFRDIFISFFFISIGMLLDTHVIVEYGIMVVIAVICIVLLKIILTSSIALFLGFSLRVAILTGLALAQVGEFSFILAREGFTLNLMNDVLYQVFLATSIITMILTPFLINSGRFVDRFIRVLHVPKKLLHKEEIKTDQTGNLENHLIILGYGVVGQHVVHAAKNAGIPYVIMDVNPETVRRESHMGEPIYFGDVSYPHVLETLGIEKAKVMLVAISDITAARRAVFLGKLANPDLYVIARARFAGEVAPLAELGADEVVSEEYEASIEIFTRVLHNFNIRGGIINSLNDELRASGYKRLRTNDDIWMKLKSIAKTDHEIGILKIPDSGSFINKNLQESGIRDSYGLNLLMVQRDDELINNPPASFIFRGSDIIVIFGRPENIEHLRVEMG